LASEQNGSR